MNDSKTNGASADIEAMLNLLASQLGAAPVIELVTIFEENSSSQISKIDAAFARADHGALKFEAHALKSSSANMGATALSSICLKIEKSKSLESETRALFEEAKTLRLVAIDAMKSWSKKSAAS